MKRYMAFQYDDYYPSGGWNDFIGYFDSIEEALAFPIMPDSVVDSESGLVVWGDSPYWQQEGKSAPATADDIRAEYAERDSLRQKQR